MKYTMLVRVTLAASLLVNPFLQPALAQGTAFTYQGQLQAGGGPAQGRYDFTFALFDNSGGISGQVGGTQTNLSVAVTNGLFTALLDFGANFPGAGRWLAVGVRTNGAGSFTTLAPLQPITPVPYAITAGKAAAGSAPAGMALIPAGPFTMGNSAGDADITDAAPIDVTVSAFYMDANFVSFSQWQSIYFWATNHSFSFSYPGSGKAPGQPVQNVNWFDCVKWLNARSQQAGRTPVYYLDTQLTQVFTNGEVTGVYANWAASGYRLPTEAEWEKAARGGLAGQRFPWGNVINENLANYTGNTAGYGYDLGPDGYNAIGSVGGISPATSPAGSFAPNALGLYDMAGNLDAWCWDYTGAGYAGGTDPHGPASGPTRVARGGSWGDNASVCRAANRNGGYPALGYDRIGLRCVLNAGQ